MLTLVMPDDLTASMTVAKAPKGTSSSARTKMDWCCGSRIFCFSLAAISLMLIGVVAQKNPLLLVDADHQALFGDLFHRPRLGHIDLDAGLQHRGGDHEDDQQHQDNVHQRRDVDVGEGSLSSSVGSRKGHYRGTPGASAVR